MLRIYTENINGRADWFHARAYVGGRYYGSFQTTRMGAFMDVLRQLAVKGYIAF